MVIFFGGGSGIGKFTEDIIINWKIINGIL